MNIPTYYVYRPYGDISDYANPLTQQDESPVIDSSEPTILPMTNLGWRTGMPYDSFVASEGNSWAAGSNVNVQSVPFVEMKKFMPYSAEGAARSFAAYRTNYGSDISSNDLVVYSNPAGSFTPPVYCTSDWTQSPKDAYNLGIGVL
jgi:hypothetical protein